METFKWILRFLLVVLFFFVIGVGVYFGYPYLYNKFMKPIEEQEVNIKNLQNQQEQNKELLSSRFADIEKKVDALKQKQDNDTEKISEIMKKLQSINDLQQNQAESADSIFKLETRMSNNEVELEKLLSMVANLEQSHQDNRDKLREAMQEIAKLSTPLAQQNEEITLLKVMELINHSRISLKDDNLGLAKNDIEAAKTLLVKLKQRTVAERIQVIEDIENRLDSALNNIIENPLLAERELEFAWQVLLLGFPQSVNQVIPTLVPTLTPTPTLNAYPSNTPAPTESL